MPTDVTGVAAAPALADGAYDRLAEQYTDRLALNWRRRAKLLESPQADFATLSDWDARMDAAVQALGLLGPASQRHMARMLESPINAGDAFAVLCHALRSGIDSLADTTAAIARTMPRLQPALVAALEWTDSGALWPQVASRLPLAAKFDLIATRPDASELLPPALEALQDEGLAADALASALRCLRRMGDTTRALAGLHYLEATDNCVRRQAAQAVLALAPTEHWAPAVDVLLSIVRGAGSEAQPAARSLALFQPQQVLPVLAELHSGSLASSPADNPANNPVPWARLHVQALGWSGDISLVPQLIEYLDAPPLARVAAAAIGLLTGLDPVRDGWQAEVPAGPAPHQHDSPGHAAAIPKADPDAGLPWPSLRAFAALWKTAQSRFTIRQPHLGGRPATAEHLRTVLRQGPLAWRPLAAARLQRLTQGPLFPTRLPARLQAALLTT
jgi:uncharacterized protein (TIGR02270 family)